MIHLLCKSEAYTYNVYHIIKAFFSSEEVIASVDEEASCYVEVCLPVPPALKAYGPFACMGDPDGSASYEDCHAKS